MLTLLSQQNTNKEVKTQDSTVDQLNKEVTYMLSLLEKQVKSSNSKDILVLKSKEELTFLFDLFEKQMEMNQANVRTLPEKTARKSDSTASDLTNVCGEMSFFIGLLQDQHSKIPDAVDPNKESLLKSLEYLQSLVKKAEQQSLGN